MKKRIRSILILALAVIMVFSMTACSDEDSVKSAAKTFMNKCESGDFDAAAKLCSSSAASSLNITNLRSYMETSFETAFKASAGISITDCSKKTQKAYEDFMDYMMKKMVASYKLNDDYDDDKKSISVKVKVLDTSSATSTVSTFQTKVQKLVTNYYKNHTNALVKLYQKKGADAVRKRVMNALALQMFELAKTDYIDQFPTKEETWKLTFEQNDSGKWLVKTATVSS